jgi:hypothetical protein
MSSSVVSRRSRCSTANDNRGKLVVHPRRSAAPTTNERHDKRETRGTIVLTGENALVHPALRYERRCVCRRPPVNARNVHNVRSAPAFDHGDFLSSLPLPRPPELDRQARVQRSDILLGEDPRDPRARCPFPLITASVTNAGIRPNLGTLPGHFASFNAGASPALINQPP